MKIKAFFLGLCLAGVVSCAKDSNSTQPYAPVNIQVNIDNPQYIDLNYPGGWVYMTGGVSGLILVRKDQSVINAFDRVSPYPDGGGCRLLVDSAGVFAIDTCSGSKWMLYDGIPNSGPARRNLIQYQTVLNGNMLTIFN